MTTIDRLQRDHQQVLTELAGVERRCLGADPSGLSHLAPCSDPKGSGPAEPMPTAGRIDVGLAAFSAFLAGEVLEHFTLEEEALFPLLGRHLGHEMGPLAVMLSEHAQFRELQEGLAQALASDDRNTQQACAREIIELLRAHIAKEDNVLFPMAERMLTPAEKAEVESRTQALGEGSRC